MEWLIETVRPDTVVPVHSQKVAWFQERWGEKVRRAAFGSAVRLGD